ncbi:hypothetical protein HOLleu_04697 [Holothuria leucospilota]|uniref:Ig-like domain-containing protein n=1 Tax=Holothuria leucospilota TaxID=206669 RepID=A0A9Q1CUQ5_HOLLE|nr:hypothetical protein HOLleu_04697 [Holothuria leucospilota]
MSCFSSFSRTVKPAVPFPIIRSCGEVSNKCYAKRDDDDAFQCSIRGARPSIILEFMARTVEGDKDILEERRTIFENGEYGALATTREVFRYSSCLVLLVCKADAAPGLLEHNESLILVQNVPMEILGTKILYRYVERNRKIVLSCAKGDAAFVVWKKRSSFEYNVYEDLLYYVLIEEKFMEIFAENINVTRRGSLVIPRVEVKHEGMYVCVSGDGVSDSTIAYKLDVIVYPNPAYPVITGCSHRDYCELRRKYQGNLTCEVKGIRPQIKLEWKIPSQQENDKITFPTHQLTVEDNGETFDVTLISTYDIQDQSLDRMTVECNVLEPSHTKLKLSRKFDLIFMRGKQRLITR